MKQRFEKCAALKATVLFSGRLQTPKAFARSSPLLDGGIAPPSNIRQKKDAASKLLDAALRILTL